MSLAQAHQTRRERQRGRRLRNARRSGLNLVALMDVFTILVFFFLVHSTDGVTDAGSARVNLPESTAHQQSAAALVVTVAHDRILVQGEPVARWDAEADKPGTALDALLSALQARRAESTGAAEEREVTIRGDRAIPYALLDQVMRTCARAGYSDISLSVQQRVPGAG
ncbi:MAG TPA: biopolymer transporter ExbD [Alphaproteobacteria bacterium]|nr:biopolymer transporter ExbD [Alphaproteobacteria bacterium]